MMFWQKYEHFVEDYDNPINRILTVILLVVALANLYLSYARFGNYEALYKYCLAIYTVVGLLYGWGFTGKSPQSLTFLFENDLPEFILRALFFSIVLINGFINGLISLAIIFFLIVSLKFALATGGDSFKDLWENNKKLLFFFRIFAFAVWFRLLLFV